MDMDVLLFKKKSKRVLSFVLVLSIIFSTFSINPQNVKKAKAAGEWNGYTSTSFEAGTGTKENPYQIKWGSQLAYLAKTVNEGESYSGKYFVVTADIVMNKTDVTGNEWDTWNSDSEGLKSWTAIGSYEGSDNNKPFAGNINGEGHTISGLWSCTRGSNGLFAYNTGTISNIIVADSYIEGGGYGVGAIAGKNAGIIYGCESRARVCSQWNDDNNIEAGSAGGIVGTNSGTVNYVNNSGAVDGVAVLGGIVGTNFGRVMNSDNSGLVGKNKKSQYGTGGIVGFNGSDESELINSYNTGKVWADNNAGGVVGINTGKVANVYNDADIDVSQNQGIAGAIAGALSKSGFDSTGSVSYSYWNKGLTITINSVAKADTDVKVVGNRGTALIGAGCLRYDAIYKLVEADSSSDASLNFTISAGTQNKTTLVDALDAWTQASEGGKASIEILRWKNDNALPEICEADNEVWNGEGSNSFGGGDGSERAPYRITNGEQLKYLATQVNSGNSYSGNHFVLASDIVLNDETFEFDSDTGLIKVTDETNTAYLGTGIKGENLGSGDSQFDSSASTLGKWYTKNGRYDDGAYPGEINPWTPIGTAGRPFAGEFDGKGYKIYGVSAKNYSSEGLFGFIDGGNVKNLEIINSCFTSADKGYVGAIAGYSSGDIVKCKITDSVICAGNADYTGGLIGYLADVKINGDGSYKENGLVFGSAFDGTVYGNGKTGGICGYTGYGNNIEECNTSKESLISGNGSALGGIAGKNYGASIVNSYNESKVKADAAAMNIGGIAGENISMGNSCLVGFASVYGVVTNCYNRGDIVGGTSSYTGGIVGQNIGGTVANTYCGPNVSTGNKVGSIVGVNSASEGEYDLYDGLTQQKYKRRNGTVKYSYYASGNAYGDNQCPKEGEVQYVSQNEQFNTGTYNLQETVLGKRNLIEALNEWIAEPIYSIDNDDSYLAYLNANVSYLEWKLPDGAYPVFDKSNVIDNPEEEPLPMYTLSYDANGEGALGVMESEKYEMTLSNTPDEDKPLVSEPAYTREGYNFVSWNTKADGTGTAYAPGNRISITENMTLYAVWVSTQAVVNDAVISGGNDVQISWNAVDDAAGYWIYRHKLADGENEFDKFVSADKIAEVDAATLSFDDSDLEAGTYYYGIRAYSISGSGITSSYIFKPFSRAEEVVIAVANIKYMRNVSEGENPVKQECIIGKAETVQDNTFTYEGFSFVGWNTKADKTGTNYAPGDSITITEDTTLYAVWKMSTVENVRAYITDTDKINISWSKSSIPDVTGYRVYCSVNAQDDYKLIGTVSDPNVLQFETDTIVPSTTYYFYVKVYKDSEISTGVLSEESEPSEEIKIVTDAVIRIDESKGGINGNKVNLIWEEQMDVTGYEIYRSMQADKIGDKIDAVPKTQLTYTDKVPYEGVFYYHIRAYNETKDNNGLVTSVSYGSYSKTFMVTVESVVIEFNSNVKIGVQKRNQTAGKNFEIELNENLFTNPGYVFAGWNTKADGSGNAYTDKQTCSFSENVVLYAMWRINVPLNFAAQLLSNKLTLTWENNQAADGYQIYQKLEEGEFVLLDTIRADDNESGEYEVKAFDRSHMYSFFIRAFVEEALGSGNQVTNYSEDSEIITVCPTETPNEQVIGVNCQINPEGNDGTKVKITWRKVNGAAGYYVYRSMIEGDIGERVGQTSELTYLDNGIKANQPGKYYYSVRAYFEDENGIYYRVPSEPCMVEFESVKLVYRPNGAEGNAIERDIIKDADGVAAEECIFVNESYDFAGWSYMIDDNETVYNPGDVLPTDIINGIIYLNARWRLQAVNITEMKVNKNSSVSIAWDSNEKASGYNIYQRKGINGTYVKVGTTDTLAYTSEVLSDVTATYYFYVVPYAITEIASGTLQTEGKESNSISVIPDPEKAASGQVTSFDTIIERDMVKLSWDPVEGVTGYYIYRSTTQGERGEQIATISDEETCIYEDSSIKEVNTYYYSVRAYVETLDSISKKPWSEYSSVTFEPCILTYNANNGSEDIISQTVIKGADVDVAENTFELAGRCFVEWNTSPIGKGFGYSSEDTIRVDTDMTLYAIWKVEKPVNVRATVSESKDSITVEWDEVSGADGYVICRKSLNGDVIFERGSSLTTSYVDLNDGKVLEDDEAYCYYVRAYQVIDSNTRRFGDYSEATDDSIAGINVKPTKPPVDKVTNLTVVDQNPEKGEVRIGWSGIPYADGYQLFYSTEPEGEKQYAGIDTEKSNVTLTLPLEETFYYYVVAYIIDKVTEEVKLGEFSEGLEVRITPAPTPSPIPSSAPTASPNPYGKITNLRGTVISGPSIELRWDELDGMESYRVYECKDEKGTSPKLISSDISGSALLISDVEENEEYYYRVRGTVTVITDKGVVQGFSDWSDVLKIKVVMTSPTPAPTATPKVSATPAPTAVPATNPPLSSQKVEAFVITDAKGSIINLAWQQFKDAVAYEISYSTTPDGAKTVVKYATAEELFCKDIVIQNAEFNVRENINVTDVQAYGQKVNAEYYYYVRAMLSEDEYSQYSSPVKISLHTEVLGAVPTKAPTAAPKSDGYKVGSKKKVGKLIYRITAKSGSNKTVEVVKPVKKTYKSIAIPATVKIGSNTYKVTSLKASAFAKNTKLVKIVIGKNITKIGTKAMYNCKKLKNIVFKTKKMKSFGKKVFRGIPMTANFTIPKSVLTNYKKMIKKTEV